MKLYSLMRKPLGERLGIWDKLFLRQKKNNVRTFKGSGIDSIENLIDSINKAKIDWLSAISNFNQADSQELTDYYTYKIKACQIRYNYLIRKIKEIYKT